MAKIDHVFVLMLENRSFDHFFGLSGLPGVPTPPASFGFKPGAVDQMRKDPPHEYEDVKTQMAGGAMTGFSNYASTGNMLGFKPADVPVLMSLAKGYLLMDNWFSSMPGPTWPNRFFAHAGSSGGLDNSPAGNDAADAVYKPDKYFQIEHGHVFDRLTTAGKTWRVYYGDRPQILALQGMVGSYVGFSHPLFRPNSNLAADLAKSDAASYTWIEPTYKPLSNFNGDSQHPLGAVSAGEGLIKRVYNAVRNSPLWESSLLVITWDEHGGFFDHVPPPQAKPPGDMPLSYDRGSPKGDCKFDVLGPRVPAILISPLLPSGLGSAVFPNKNFDHGSIVASVRSHFGLTTQLTDRDGFAPDWTSAILSSPRADVLGPLTLKTASAVLADKPNPNLPLVKGPPSPNLAGFLAIARSVDYELAKMSGTAALSVSDHQKDIEAAHALLARPNPKPADQTKAHRLLVKYMAAVNAREAAARRQHRKAIAASRKRSAASSSEKKKPARRRVGSR